MRKHYVVAPSAEAKRRDDKPEIHTGHARVELKRLYPPIEV